MRTDLSILFDKFSDGDVSRRSFVQRASALGMSAVGAAWLANGGNPAAAQTPAATPSGAVFEAPTFGTDGLERGAAGELRILWWQAPTVLNPHLNGDAGAQFVLEPLLAYAPDSTIIPVLVDATPTVDNGLLAEDFSSVSFRTWKDSSGAMASQ